MNSHKRNEGVDGASLRRTGGPGFTLIELLVVIAIIAILAALVRLRGRLHGGVKVPVRPTYHRPVTEGYCVVATRGGELLEVNCQSVTKNHRR